MLNVNEFLHILFYLRIVPKSSLKPLRITIFALAFNQLCLNSIVKLPSFIVKLFKVILTACLQVIENQYFSYLCFP